MAPLNTAMRVCMVTGSPSSGRCGIHDYALALSYALREQNVLVDIVDQRDWSVGGTLSLVRRVRKRRPDILHMQYPMIVGWRSLGPHTLGWVAGAPQVITLHEFSSLDRLRRGSMWAFAISANTIALTTEFEAARFLQEFPRAKKKTLTIPIGSSIPYVRPRGGIERERTVAYFGQIKPLKGLEQFVELMQLSTTRGRPWTFRIIGSPVTWDAGYLAHLQQSTKRLPVQWLIGLANTDAANALATSSAAYLPYPDGVSERRSTLLAALGNGVPVISTDGPFATESLRKAVLFAEAPGCAEDILARLFDDEELQERMRAAGRAYSLHFTWPKIASAYIGVYREAIRTGLRNA